MTGVIRVHLARDMHRHRKRTIEHVRGGLIMNDVVRYEETGACAERWASWPVYWSAVWVGTLTALAVALVVGLVGLAIGAHVVNADPWVETRQIGWGTVILGIVGSFLAFVAGGWAAGKVAGFYRSEPSMLHGGIVWLLSIPFLVAFAALGAGSYFGSWYGGLAGTPAWSERTALTAPGTDATDAERTAYDTAREREARAARNTALGTVTALLLGLVGSVLGGWMASGEPMTLTYYRNRRQTTPTHARTATPAGVS
jgi:hypothetical protein